MSRKLLRILIVIVALCSVSIVLSLCIRGLLSNRGIEFNIKFIEVIIRCVSICIFAFFYYFSFSRNFESSGIFMPLYLMFAVISEFRISEDVAKVSNRLIIPPNILVYVFLFSNIMMAFSLIGYCVFYDSPEKKTVGTYIYTSLAVGVVVSTILPKPQSMSLVLYSREIMALTIIMFALCFVTCIILIISDIHSPYLVRHLAALLFIISNYINLFYDTFLMNLIGTGVFVAACVLIITVSKINEIRL